jgi:hypothetical protein
MKKFLVIKVVVAKIVMLALLVAISADLELLLIVMMKNTLM